MEDFFANLPDWMVGGQSGFPEAVAVLFFWCLSIVLILWIFNDRIKRIDRGWVVAWETKHNAPIKKHRENISRGLTVTKVVAWLMGVVTLSLGIYGAEILPFLLSDRAPLLFGQATQSLRVQYISSFFLLIFSVVFLALLCAGLKKKIKRLDEAINHKASQ